MRGHPSIIFSLILEILTPLISLDLHHIRNLFFLAFFFAPNFAMTFLNSSCPALTPAAFIN